MDNEMIDRLTPILMKHNPQTKIGATIVMVELLQAMREPTEKMVSAGAYYSTAQSGVYDCEDVWHTLIDAIIGE